jgi:hypothetical protein
LPKLKAVPPQKGPERRRGISGSGLGFARSGGERAVARLGLEREMSRC